MPLITLINNKSFSAEDGTTILDAAAKEGIHIAYSCKSGRCSTCKCKVLSGASIALEPEIGLSADETAGGWILSCVRIATASMTLEIADVIDVILPPVKTLPCRIQSITYFTDDIIQVLLRLPPSSNFSYLPGQYIDVIGPNGIRRSYSLASVDPVNQILELHIRAVANGLMSEYWFRQAKTNDLLRLNGPLGTFFLRNIENRDLVFLATGTGIAPVKSMVAALSSTTDGPAPKSITVFWGARKQSDIYFDFNTVAKNIHFIPVLSQPDTSWEGAKGYVQHALLDRQYQLSEATVYACGSPNMIHDARLLLLNSGLPGDQFNSDAFVCSAKN
jgi:CDP-4-dehydro-6-deoxyglucose reductase, E3